MDSETPDIITLIPPAPRPRPHPYVVSMPCDVRALLQITPRRIINAMLERAMRGELPVPDWPIRDCSRTFVLDRPRADALKRAYGSVARGLRAVAAAAVAETQKLIEAISSRGCVSLQEAADMLGIDDFGAERLLRALGYHRTVLGHRAYYCRPGVAEFKVNDVVITPSAVETAVKRLTRGCRTRICSIRLASLMSELGLPRKNVIATKIIGALAAKMGYQVRRWGRRVYIVVERQAGE
jgi:hypothetical protein